MKKIIYLLVILWSLPVLAQQEPTEIYNNANNLYQLKQYEEALEGYKSIYEMGYESADLFYNMGNCYYRTGQLAPAILYYERAQRLAPTDEDVSYNLSIANQRTVDEIEKVPVPIVKRTWKNFTSYFTANGWGIASILLIFITIIHLVFFRLVNSVSLKKLMFFGALIFFFVSIVSLSAGYARYSFQNQKEAIVFAQTAYVKSEPSMDSDDAFLLHEGTKVSITEEFDGWSRIKLTDGKTGWITQTDIVEI